MGKEIPDYHPTELTLSSAASVNNEAHRHDQNGHDRNGHDWILIAAVATNGVIGRSGGLPWILKGDLKRFRTLTMGHCLLMGRKTFESIGKALPGRQTIVVSRNSQLLLPAGVLRANDLREVPQLVEPGRRVMVVGGSEIYRLAIPRCSGLWITRVLADIPGDTILPEIDWSQWQLQSSEYHESGPYDEYPAEFQQWQRKAMMHK